MFARHLVSRHQAALLKERARLMRFAPTASEHRLWQQLSGSKLGVGFRRQLVIGPFIVDFASTQCRLVVEIDGASHQGRDLKDAARDRRLAELGWRTVRFSDTEVMADVARVLGVIRGLVAPFASQLPRAGQ